MSNHYLTCDTKSSAYDIARDQGLSGEALELAVSAGAKQRHEKRVAATLNAAFEAIGKNNNEGLTELIIITETRVFTAEREIAAGMFLIILADLIGIGGPMGLGGQNCSTDRMPWAHQLGKGRWNASDGGAYKAAAICALRKIGDKLLPILPETGMKIRDYQAYLYAEGGKVYCDFDTIRDDLEFSGATILHVPYPESRSKVIAGRVITGKGLDSEIDSGLRIVFDDNLESWSDVYNQRP